MIRGATPGRVAGFVSETIQGVGGAVPLADGCAPFIFWRGWRNGRASADLRGVQCRVKIGGAAGAAWQHISTATHQRLT